MSVEFFKDGDHMSIVSTAQDEHHFMDDCVKVLSKLIESGKYDNDWDFQLEIWLPQIVDLVCKYRGYKANVVEKRMLTAGNPAPNKQDLVLSSDDLYNRSVVNDSTEDDDK